MDGLKATLSFDIGAHDYDAEYIYIDAITREIEIQNPNKIRKELDSIGFNLKHIYCDFDSISKYIVNSF